VSVLLPGRAILGGAESFIITGAVAWGLALVDKEHAGKVIAWVGTAMFAAMALGGPVGTLLFDAFGFEAIVLTFLLPLLVLAYLARMPAVAPHPHAAQTSLAPSCTRSGYPAWVLHWRAQATAPSWPSAHCITAP
jgi:predicted MFS family arabinose efflux permease